MACLNVTVTPVDAQVALGVTPTEGASLAVTPTEAASLKVTPKAGASLKVTPVGALTMEVTPTPPATLTIGEVCTVSGGTIVVLAASDGIIYTRDGGYLLLNPATNPPEG